MKVCRKCQKAKDESEFRDNPNHKSKRNDCRECERLVQAARYAANPEAFAAATRKWSKTHPEQRNATKRAWYANNKRKHKSTVLKSAYGITLAQYETLLDTQGGVCAICKTSTNGNCGRKLYVDHCHKTGKVRGLLCGRCNSILGFVDDSPDWLEKAKAYLIASVGAPVSTQPDSTPQPEAHPSSLRNEALWPHGSESCPP